MSDTEVVPANVDDEDIGSEDENVLAWKDLYDRVFGRSEAITGDAFLKKYQDPKNARAELRDWIYPFILKAVEAGGGQAVVLGELQDQIEDLQEDVERLGNLTRAIASTNYFQLVQHLVNLVMTRSQDPELLAAAQTIAVLFATPTPVVPAMPVDPSTVPPAAPAVG